MSGPVSTPIFDGLASTRRHRGAAVSLQLAAPAHAVRLALRSTGWLRWRGVCDCGWTVTAPSRAALTRDTEGHASTVTRAGGTATLTWGPAS